MLFDKASMSAAMELSRDIFVAMDKDWRGDDDGIWRPAYSKQETDAIDIIGAEAKRLGMRACYDLAGNAYFIYPGQNREAPVFMTGSHVDAVPHGGRWDGMAGVVVGLAAVKLLHANGITPQQDIVLVAFRGEESAWFNQALLGSGFACGRVGVSCLDNKRNDNQKTLSSHMSDIGLDVDALRKYLDAGKSLVPLDQILVFIEVHIEQSYTLQRANNDLGIVTGIRGNVRCPEMITFLGEAAHTGSTPQADRKDASIAAAYYQVLLDCKFQEIKKRADIVWAITGGEVVEASPTTVSKRYKVRPEVRSLDMDVLILAKDIFYDCAWQVAKERGVGVEIRSEGVVINEPVILDESVQENIYKITFSLELNASFLPSGSGHDAANFAKSGVKTGMIFIPHGNNGISHNPKEIMAASVEDDPFSLDGGFCNAVCGVTQMMMEYRGDVSCRAEGFEDFMKKSA